jgi:hypothetical protein
MLGCDTRRYTVAFSPERFLKVGVVEGLAAEGWVEAIVVAIAELSAISKIPDTTAWCDEQARASA